MIERIIEFSIRNRFLVIFAALATALVGLYALHKTPVDAIPDLSENQVIVFTDWMGRSPKEIEDQITYPLSVNLQGLAGVKTVRSSSEFNFSMINIIFEDNTDFYFARTRVLERLTLASTFLPQGVTPYLAPDATALGQIFWYTVEGKGYSADRLRSLQDWFVRYQINSVPGVAQVSTAGGFPKEYQVDIDPEKLRAYNVTLGQIVDAVSRSNSAVGGRVVQKNKAEYLVRGAGWIESPEDISKTVLESRKGVPVTIGDVAHVTIGPGFRRSVLEKNGSESVGAVVMMRYGENPLEVTQRIHAKIRELQKGLPEGVKIVPFYDRTRLIEGAIHTVTRTMIEAILIATVAILLILGHLRSTLVVSITLPLAVLIAFILMWKFGIASNIMSLAGIVISIGILVDPAIVMLENATHHLTKHFGDRKVTGDTTELLVEPCRQVGRPIFFAVLIMLVSFLPVFALSGMEGRMFHPLAYTKTFAMIGTAILAITLVPALIPILIRGRLKREEDNWIVRSFIEVYRPVLLWLLHRPKTVMWMFACLLALGFYFFRHSGREFMPVLNEGTIVDMPISVPRMSVTQLSDDLKQRDAILREFPEVENVVGKGGRADTPTDPSPLDMVESIVNLQPKELWPKRHLRYEDALAENRRIVSGLASAGVLSTTSTADQKENLAKGAMDSYSAFDARMRHESMKRRVALEERLGLSSITELGHLLYRHIDEINGWKRTPTDAEKQLAIASATQRHAAEFRTAPLLFDVEQTGREILDELAGKGLIESTSDALKDSSGVSWSSLKRQFNSLIGRSEGDQFQRAREAVAAYQHDEWMQQLKKINWELFDIGVPFYVREAAQELSTGAKSQGLLSPSFDTSKLANAAEQVASEREGEFKKTVFLWQGTREDLLKELDSRVRTLGWVNIWTQPIINRIDMLATGVRTQVGIKVYGPDSETIQKVSNQVAEAVRGVRGAVDVVADQSIGKGYIDIKIDRDRAARYAVSVADIQDVIEVALGGKTITTTVEGRERYPVRVRYARDFREDEESIRRVLVATNSASSMPAGSARGEAGMASTATAEPSDANPTQVLLGDVADIRVVEGPVMIKSENGLLRSYVQLNVRDRDMVGFVEEAQRTVAEKVQLPAKSYLEWSGQFEHQVRARKTLSLVFPAVITLIFLILYLTYHDLADALLMMMAVPGALAGGVLFQTLFGYNFSVAVWVGYIACFGMATETGIVMLVYLRNAIAERGGLEGIKSLEELGRTVVSGAVHRLRPKLLTEGTAIIGLVPLLWADGVGSEIIKPMAAPVLGGLLIADEVIDVFLPVLFYHVRARRWRKLHSATGASAQHDSPAASNSSLTTSTQGANS
ncbi:MAG: efflux RND transporter permease subunit [Candidatus Sumerlaeaceae bacterium]